jgi:hypothetical protein
VYLLSNKLNNFSHVATLQFILPTPCFWLGQWGWLLVLICYERSWLLVLICSKRKILLASLFWEKSTVSWWLMSQMNSVATLQFILHTPCFWLGAGCWY